MDRCGIIARRRARRNAGAEAWDALLACEGQLRLAPSGHVIGVDMDVAIELAAARGYDLAVVAELLPAAEAGLVEALNTTAE